MSTKAKEYGIWNGQVCEWVTVRERRAPGYHYKEITPRILKNAEITALLNAAPADKPTGDDE